MEIKLHKGQLRIWKEIEGAKKKGARHFIVNCPRQFGKTYLFKSLIIYNGISEKKKSMLWISQYLSNSRKIFEDVLYDIEMSDVVERANRQDLFIRFKNGNIIYFKGADNPKSIRGLSFNVIFMDEFAHYSNVDDLYYKVVMPTTTAFRKEFEIYIVSTPKGKNLFYKLAQKGKDKRNTLFSYHEGNYRESPFVDMDVVKDAKENLPNEAFLQEYEAKFIDNDSGMFRWLDRAASITKFSPPEYSVTYYAGIDWGRLSDRTVLTILDQTGQVVYAWKSAKDAGWEDSMKQIILHLRRYRVKFGYAESNSAGDVLIEALRKQFNRVEPFYTTNVSKRQIIEALQLAFDRSEIKIPSLKLYPYYLEELSTFERKTTTSGKMSYSAAYGSHDDHVMSLALAWQAYSKYKHMGNYFLL